MGIPAVMGALASTYKRANVFTHCTAEASLYERAEAARTTSNCHHAYACQCGQRSTVPEQEST